VRSAILANNDGDVPSEMERLMRKIILVRKIITAILGLAMTIGVAGEALASPTCTTEPEAK
jgi:hypothetical protein